MIVAILFGAPARALDPGKAISQYIQATWSNQTGLPQNSVHTLAQTTDGYLWFGTEEGLVRFDGVRFKIFDDRNSHGLPDSFVTHLLVTHDGALWVSTRNAVSRYRDGVFHTYTPADGLFPEDVNSLCEGNDGSVWIATGGGLNQLKDGRIRSFTEKDGLPDRNITAMTKTTDGALWLGSLHGLTRFRNSRFTTFRAADGLPGDSVETLAPAKDGTLWVATRGGLAHWSGSRGTLLRSISVSPSDLIQALLEDRDGSLWIGWTRGGLTRVSRDGGLAKYSRNEGLPSNGISSLFEDREGNLWVGSSDSGLTELRDGKFTTFGRHEGLSSETLWSVLEGRDGTIWAGTDDGGLNRIRGLQVTAFTARQGLPNNAVDGMLEAPDGSLWLGSEDGWVTKIKGNRITKYRDALSKRGRVVAMETGPGESLWVGFHEPNGLALMENGQFKHYAVPGLVNTLYPDGAGGLWVGTDHGGVSRFQNGKFTTYTKKDGLLSDFAQAIYVDKQGMVWVGTSPGGLNRISGGKITSFSVDQGLFNETVGAIVEDDAGYLWMTCNKGIFKVLKEELNDFAEGRLSFIHSIVYGVADGMRSPECDFGASPSAWKSRDGRLWFATSAGVAMIDPNRITSGKRPPAVWIESISFDHKLVPLRSGLRFGPDSGRLEVQFSAPSFIAPDKMLFRYKLVGFDSKWSDPGSSREASYTNLPAGKYHFRVRASNSDGSWNLDGAAIDFQVLPHFYQAWWFYALCILVLAYCCWAVLRLRTRYLLSRNQELGVRVAERTAELEKAITAAEAAREALRERATRDGLTGLWNRNAVFEILENELARATRHSHPVSVVMADLDFFKSINDTYGHMSGDTVLREASRRICELMRTYDSAGRYGGEEILIVLPSCSLADAERRAEDLRLAINGQDFLLDAGALSLSCSFGVACSDDHEGLGALVSAADAALYSAKSGGRNRVEVFCPTTEERSSLQPC